MKKAITGFILGTLICFGCKKISVTETCGCHGPSTEFVQQIFGMVIETDDGFEILTDEKGLLIPCFGLAKDFRKEAKPVTLSGILKVPCKRISDKFDITPVFITGLKSRNTTYDKTDITIEIFKSDIAENSGFGYFIEDHRTTNGTRILQPHIPAIPGLIPFRSSDEARKTALLVTYLIRNNPDESASLSTEILQYTHVIK